jgi:hypothetical protein
MSTEHSVVDLLPGVPIADSGPVSRAFLRERCTNFRTAARFAWELAYGRNLSPSAPTAVLDERRGTCSTKHALLARLARELQIDDLELRTGIYDMSEANTPGVGEVLAAHGLRAIPEAHCYLVYRAERIDLTRTDGIGIEPISNFHVELPIEPEQIGDFKRAFHREYLQSIAGKGDFKMFDADELWAIREECIAALGRAGSPP